MKFLSIPSTPYVARLLRFYIVRYHHVEETSLAPSPRLPDIAYVAGLIELYKPHIIKLLRMMLELVSSTA